MIGELGQLGIKAGVEGGKIAIKQDFVAAKKGEPVKEKIASLLLKLGVEPMEISLNMTGLYENEKAALSRLDSKVVEKGKFYPTQDIIVDENVYIDRIATAALHALNLSVQAEYPTKESIELLISKSHSEAVALKNELKI